MIDNNKNGRPIMMKPMAGGSIKLTIGPDGIPQTESDRGIEMKDMPIKAIGLTNLLDLAQIVMSKTSGRTMILGTFKDGGTFEIIYTDSGRLEELAGTQIHTQISTTDPDGNILMLGQKISA